MKDCMDKYQEAMLAEAKDGEAHKLLEELRDIKEQMKKEKTKSFFTGLLISTCLQAIMIAVFI